MTDDSRWPLPLVRAVLETAILAVLVREPLHGYAIAGALADAGLGRLKGGSLYPVLARLEEAGDVTTAWEAGESGPGRRSYTITARGRARLTSDLESVADLAGTLAVIADQGEQG